MRRILQSDVVAAARALLAVRKTERGWLVRRMIFEAAEADKYRLSHGLAHPFWGDGSLEVAASARQQIAEPYLDEPDNCYCMILVFEALVTWRRANHACK